MTKEQSSGASKMLDTTREAVDRTELEDFLYQCECNISYLRESEHVVARIGHGHLIEKFSTLLAAKEAAEASATAAWENAKERRSQVYEMRARAEYAEARADAAIFAMRDVVTEYPVAAGKAKFIPPDEQGYGSIYRARQLLATLDQPKETTDEME